MDLLFPGSPGFQINAQKKVEDYLMSEIKKAAMITVCGRPNVGKSSLTNALVGEKVAIVSNKAQTTRNRICGVVNRDDTQFVLMDTPGLHKPKSALGDYMVKVITASLSDVDCALLLVEPIAHGDGDQVERAAVDAGGGHDVVAAGADVEQGEKVGRLTGGGQHRRRAAFQFADFVGHIVVGGILETGVEITAGLQIEQLAHALVNLRFDGDAVGPLDGLPGINRNQGILPFPRRLAAARTCFSPKTPSSRSMGTLTDFMTGARQTCKCHTVPTAACPGPTWRGMPPQSQGH